MTKEQFDVLVQLEKERNGLSVEEIVVKVNNGNFCVEELLKSLRELGYVENNCITDKGIEALAPYKTKRAVFIAAGFGSRLRPVTLTRPKPLVTVNGVRIIDTLLDAVIEAGIEEIYIVCGYFGEQFEELKTKYPNIRLITNSMYTEANNISSVLLAREYLQNAYVLEADLYIHNKNIFDKYLYHSVYLGIPTDKTDDWYFKTDDQGIINELGIGNSNCYQMLGISYWDIEDGRRLPEHIVATFNMPGGKDQDWCYVPLVSFKNEYKVHVRECASDDIQEIDTFEELKAIDPSYE